MADRPILFSAPMVLALLAGTKVQTRRVIKGVPMFSPEYDAEWRPHVLRPGGSIPDEWSWWEGPPHGPSCYHTTKLAIEKGDRLWVRESFSYDRIDVDHDGLMPPWYWADGNPETGDWTRPKPSIHMRRTYSRITLLVDGVKVERLQDISEEDALAEGVPTNNDYAGSFEEVYCRKCGGSSVHAAFGAGYGVTEVDCSECETAKMRYRNLWDHINGEGSWAANPWVAAYTFRVVLGNIDQIGGAA